MAKVSINKRGVDKMMKEIQREFDQHSVTVPVTAERPVFRAIQEPTTAKEAGPTTVYNGPVVINNVTNGDGAQVAWGNEQVTQTSNTQNQIASGFEPVAQALAKVLEGLPNAGLDAADQEMVREETDKVLHEVTKTEPDQGLVKRGVALVKGVLSPVATGAQEGISESAKGWASTAIKMLTTAVIF